MLYKLETNNSNLKCITEGSFYEGVPVRKERDSKSSYNSRYTTRWEYCDLEDATSFEIIDDISTRRCIAAKNFRVIGELDA